jgi:hypothetical protein
MPAKIRNQFDRLPANLLALGLARLSPAEREQTHQAPNVPRLRPVTIIGAPGAELPAAKATSLVARQTRLSIPSR